LDQASYYDTLIGEIQYYENHNMHFQCVQPNQLEYTQKMFMIMMVYALNMMKLWSFCLYCCYAGIFSTSEQDVMTMRAISFL
jgi:hypothetical protein